MQVNAPETHQNERFWARLWHASSKNHVHWGSIEACQRKWHARDEIKMRGGQIVILGSNFPGFWSRRTTIFSAAPADHYVFK
jgi:hypothetical protein